MKQYNFHINNLRTLHSVLSDLKATTKQRSYSSMLFHIYSITFNDNQLKAAQEEIHEIFPNGLICGVSTNGDICDGLLSEYGMVLAVSIFDTTEVAIQMIHCTPGSEELVGCQIRNIIDETPNIKAAEILITIKSIDTYEVLKAAEDTKKNIPIFGGGSSDTTIFDDNTKIISNDDISHTGVVLITYRGDDLVVDVHHVIGWKPLGKDFTATKIEGNRLYELNNIPAGNVYSHYLDIKADDDFFINALEFPIISDQHGFEVLRLPFSCDNNDKSIVLAARIDEGTTVHLSYGDPEVIKNDVNELTATVKSFAPQAIFLISCGVRRIYWKYLINEETGPFAAIAPVAGFYSSGEIMRMDNHLVEHHVTLIAVSMREGGKADAQPSAKEVTLLPMSEQEKMHSQISMVRRLANFINVTAAELRATNEKLQEMADTDELTGLYNRRMLTRLLHDALIRANKYNLDMVVGIVDIDHFKQVNDTFGHAAGDQVLKTLGKAMYREVEKLPSGVFGRWGGEEFLFIAPTLNIETIFKNIDLARERVSAIPIEGVGNITISLGCTGFKQGDTLESIFSRADAALYEAKETGRNKSCIK